MTGSSGSSEWYQQWDMAAVHAYEARRVFIECIMHGEPKADIVKAALAIAAEDDAIGAPDLMMTHVPGCNSGCLLP